MAWFKRKRDDAPADDTAEVVAPAAAPEPEAGADQPTAAPAWTTAAPMPSVIPTIQRSLGRIEARSATTLGRPAPLCLAPLGHAVTPDAPAGVIGRLAVAEHAGDDHGWAMHDQPPLDYVQRAPAGAVSPRPQAPAQLLVPSFQPRRLPSVPVAAPEVQRASQTSSFTTAPDPTPPLVLPAGEVLSSPHAPEPEGPPSASPAPAEAPLLADHASPAAPPAAPPAASPAAPAVQRAPAAELPLAPAPRHAERPGHVDGDVAPEQAEAQRAPLDGPSPAAPSPTVTAPDAPLLADAPLLPAAPLAGPEALAAPSEATVTPAEDLPLAPVQRHADHPGHVDGDEAPAEPAEVQRAAVDAPAPAPAGSAPPVESAPRVESAAPVGSAPLVGDAPPLPSLPTSAVSGPGAPGAAPSAPEPDLPLPATPVQRTSAERRPVGLGAPIPAVPPGATDPAAVQRAPLAGPPAAPPAPAAPLVGQGPSPPAPVAPLAAAPQAAAGHEEGGAAVGDEPALDLVSRAPAGSPSPSGAGSAPATGADAGSGTVAPLVGEAPLELSIDTSPEAASAPSAGGAPVAVPVPELELVQRASLASTGAASTSWAAPAAGSSTSAATPATAPLPPLVVAPLLGGRPFATQVQRAARAPASAPAGLVDRSSPEALSAEPGRTYQPLAGIGLWNGAPPPDLPGPAVEAPPAHIASAVQRAIGTDVSNTRIRRDTGPTAQRLAARAFTHEGEVHIPASVGSLSSGEGASLATHELVHAGQQSVLGSSRPHEHTPEGQHLEAQARAAEHASLADLELPRLPLAPAAPAVQRAAAETTSSPFSAHQLDTLLRLADSPPGGDVPIQRAELAAPPRPSTPAPALPDEGGAGPGEARQKTPQELEDLAHKLFPFMRNLFRGELLGFRRRSGTSSDRPLS